MADERSISRLDRELRVNLERETPNWSKQDKKIIAFAKSHAVVFRRCVVKWKKGNYEKIFNNLWNSQNRGSVDTSALSQRWLVIKNLYLNYKAKKINLDSKYFDGRLSFLSSKKKKKRGTSKLINIGLLKASTTSDEIKTQTNDELDSTKISKAIQNKKFTNSINVNAPKCSDNLTVPIEINASKESKATTQSFPMPSNVEVYKPGSLVSGAYLEVQPDLKEITESEALYLCKYHFGKDLHDETFLLKKNISVSKSVSSSTTVSVEEALATMNVGKKDACKESITLYSVNADNDATNTSVAVNEVKQATSSHDLTNVKVLIHPNEDTRSFFRGIGKYVANKYPDQKQNEILLEVCSLITAAELELLDDDE